MTKEQFFEKYVGYKIAIHLPTRELAYELMAEAERYGIEFDAKDTFNALQRQYKERFCITFKYNKWVWCNYEYYTSQGYKIIEYKGEKKMKAREGLIAEIFEKEFDIKVDEDFIIVGPSYNTYKLRKSGYLMDSENWVHRNLLIEILNGECEIEKIPPNHTKITELETELRKMSVRQNEIADELKKLKG